MAVVLGEVLHTGAETRIIAADIEGAGGPAVLKVPREDMPAGRVEARLRHEHALLAELAGPSIIRTHGLVQRGSGVALALERWGEMSLAGALARGPLPIETALRLGAAITRALAHVHRRGVIHRDVKPQNVLVDAGLREVRLIDFGIASRKPTRVDHEAPVEALAGTLAYMAPEQTGRLRRAVDQRADLYGLGATLYEMLTGAAPFEAAGAMELIHAHLARTPIPPHERAPARGIPRAVSGIVERLLEKSPERRYQTAAGVAFDLELAARALAEGGALDPFPLGTRDWEDRIRKPSRLFGRERELAALRASLDRVRDGAVELTLVAGPSGVGKSALVAAIRGEVRARRGLFASGKFEQLLRDVARAAPAQALGAVVRQSLAAPEEALARLREAWSEALGENARVLVDLVPELAHVIGEPPPVPELGAAEAGARLHAAVVRFVRATAGAEQPLALFLDDLQWSDRASLDLLRDILEDPGISHLLLLGAYRDDEVDAAHPLHALVEAAAARGRSARTITLAPLDDAALGAMVGDLLDRPAEGVAGLAALVKAKTDGSPFFAQELLEALHERGLLARDLDRGDWRWEHDRIEREGVTDNVARLLSARIGALPALPRRALSLGACAGSSFDAEILAEAGGIPRGDLRDAIEALARVGLLVPAGDDDADERWAFAHDRVQQAADAELGEEERAAAHLALARAMERRGAAEARDDLLFATLNHRLRALSLLDEPPERRRVAEALLRGGRRAKAGSAYALAASFLRGAAALLGEAAWGDAFELTHDAQLALAEAEWLAGRPDAGEPLFRDCMARARDRWQRARAVVTQAPLLFLAGRYDEGLEAALSALEELGLRFPREPEGQQAFVGELVGRLAPRIAAVERAAWRTLAPCADPAELLTAELLGAARLLSGAVQPTLQLCLVFTIVEHTFLHGASPATPSAMSMATICLVGPLQLVELGAKCAELSLDLLDRPGVARAGATFEISLAGTFVLPLPRVLELRRDVADVCQREGSVVYEDFARSVGPLLDVLAGRPLEHCAVPDRTWRNAMTAEIAAMVPPLRDALAGAGAEDPAAAIAAQASVATSSPTGAGMKTHAAAYAAMHLGEDAEALRLALAAEPMWMALYCTPPEVWMLQVLAALAPTAAPADEALAQALRDRAAFHRARLARYAAVSPGTFRHTLLLAEAGEARAADRHEEAARCFEEAIADAQRGGFMNGEALGLRLAGEHALSRGHSRAARGYLRDAHDTYLRWGARAAAARLRARYPEFFPAGRERAATAPGANVPTFTGSYTVDALGLDRRLDAASVLRAAHALAEDVVMGSLLGRVLRVLAENAGAERAALALARGGELRVRAELSLDPEVLDADLDEPVDGSARVPGTLLRYVARSREPLVLDEGSAEGRFDADPCLRARRPASVLAVPLLHRGRLVGVMYLEHRRATEAFPEHRIETITLLAAQAATAVENAALYAELSASNERLELQVEERTAALRDSNERLGLELVERARAEEERAALQERIISAQRERLLELSTPLVPITDHIVAMPLVGVLDVERAKLLMETALHGAAARGAAFVILDVTGARGVGADVADMLVRTGQGLGLLGARAVITGISPEVGRALVESGASLGSLVTRATLQDGIAYAMQRSRSGASSGRVMEKVGVESRTPLNRIAR